MEQSRVQNSIKNSMFAVLLRLLQIAFPFVTRTIIVRSLGLAYVGVSGLFTSIFGVLNITELGVGSALLQALYEPIKNNDTIKINAITAFYRRAYLYIGITVSAIGSLIIPFLRYIIKAGTYPNDLNIYYIYIVGLFGTALGYMIYAYKSLLLEAFQRGRVANKVRIVVSFFQYGVQIPLLIATKNYYLYITVELGFSLLTILLIARACNKELPGYGPKGKLMHEDTIKLRKNILALFLYKVGSTVNNNVDGIVISAVLGATILGAYNNYYLIVSSISAMISVCYTAILPSVGNVLSVKSKNDMYKYFQIVAIGDAWLIGWCTICFSCLLEPCIKILAGVGSSQGIGFSVLFALYFYVWRFPDALSLFKDALGLWQKDKWRPLLTAVLNLSLNIVLTPKIGLYGILLSTIIAVLLINFPLSMKCIMEYFGRSIKEYLFPQIKSFFIVVIIGFITYGCCLLIYSGNKYINFLTRMIICIVVPNLLYYFAYRLLEGKDCMQSKSIRSAYAYVQKNLFKFRR